MVLMRRRDKRSGNEAEEIAVASDPSITATKGLRSMGGARSGRFAADMRVNRGGFGRADKTWGVDHPWHSTQEGDLFAQLCAKDHMEEGGQTHEETHEEPVLGLSRAQLKKRKAKLKKQGLTAKQAAEEALKEAEEAKKRHEEEELLKEQQMIEQQEEIKRKRQERKQQKKLEQEQETEENKEEKKEKVMELKRVKRKQEKQKKKEKKQEAVEQAEQQTFEQEEEMKAREVLASAYEENAGRQVTTKSGLVLQDQRVGQGKLPYTGEMLTVKYRGRLGRDSFVFGKGMLTTSYGTGSVIAGWEEGLGTMRPGGLRVLTIPSELGYGEAGKGDKIPPNATLYFEVELVRIGKRKRETIGEDDIPLPSSFQRKRVKQKSGKNREEDDDGEVKLSKSQQKRRRRNRNKNLAQVDDN